jgi:putative tricarboxylic transport membrane protein
MTTAMRWWLAGAAAVVAAAAAGGAAAQATWKPDKAVEIILGVSPGGPQDQMGRLLQKVLTDGKGFEVPITAINKPGGGGAVGLAYVNQRAGDGRVVMIVAPTLLTNQITGRAPFGYADFTPIAVLGVEYETVVVRADSPFKTGRDIIERLRKDPSSLSIAIGTAPGNAAHIAFAHAMKVAGVDVKRLKTVSFNSNGDGTMALLGGHVDLESAPASIVMPHLQTGKVRLLAISSPLRGRGDLAAVPTWKELGINSVNEVWRGLVAPKGLTPAQVAFWDDVLSKAARSDEWKRELDRNQIENVYRNSAESLKFWKEEYEETKAILTEIGMAK